MTYNELRKLNNEKHKKLSKINDYKMSDISRYIRSLDIGNYQSELIRQSVLDTMLKAESEGKKPESVMGNDYKKYVNSLFLNMPEATEKEMKLDMLRVIIPAVLILVLLKVLYELANMVLIGKNSVSLMDPIKVSLGDLGVFAVILGIVLTVLNFIKDPTNKGIDRSKSFFQRLITYFSPPGVILFIGGLISFLLFKDAFILSVPILLGVGIPVVAFIVFKIIENSLSAKAEGYVVPDLDKIPNVESNKKKDQKPTAYKK